MESQIKEYLSILRTKCERFPILTKVEESINVPKEYFVLVVSTLTAILVFFCMGAGSLCNMVGFLYPAWKSFQAIESHNKGDDTQWLIYWIVYAFFSIMEVFVDFLLYWIPFYYAFKLAFLLWAMLPQTKGAKFLYDSFLKDFLKQNESKIDTKLTAASRKASKMASETAAATSELAATGIAAAKEYSKKTDGAEVEGKKDD